MLHNIYSYMDNLLIGWFGLYASNHNDKERETERKENEMIQIKKAQDTTSIFTKRNQSKDLNGIYRACALWERISKIYSYYTHEWNVISNEDLEMLR